MKKNSINIFLIVCLSTIFSCTDLNENIYSSITETSYEYEKGDATKLVGAIYANLRDFYSNANRTQEISSDEIVMPANMVGGWDDGGIYRRMHMHNWNSELTIIYDFWKTLYHGIILSNQVLNKLQNDNIPLADNEDKNMLMAEVKVLRAFYYWIVIDNWSIPPLIIDDTDDLPENSDRNTIFNFIVNELNTAIPALSEEKSERTYGRFNKWAAHALLANIYLNAEVYIGKSMWEECIQECDKIIVSKKYQLDNDYRIPFSSNNEISNENILVIPYDEIYGKGFRYYLDALHKANKDTYNLESTPYGTGAYKGVPQFIDTYDKDDDRLYATWLMGPQYKLNGDPCLGFIDLKDKPLIYENKMKDGVQVGEGEGYRWLKYEIPIGAKNSLNNDFVLFRYAQIYMMKAESLLRLGRDVDTAAELVSLVRARAFKSNPDKANVTSEELLEPSSYIYGTVTDYVLSPQNELLPAKLGRFYDELGWEFAGELFRRRDMIRFGVYTKAQWLSHSTSAKFREVFPIPLRILDANYKLKQDPNY